MSKKIFLKLQCPFLLATFILVQAFGWSVHAQSTRATEHAQAVRATPHAAAAKDAADDEWWKHAVFYEIYPRSFQDSNGDGVGDLNGITQRLDYLKALGVDAIWLTPIYPSPQVDFGYDISDYENVDPQYGTLKDFDRLQAEAQKRGIRIIMDSVMNHTSDKHPWFIESRSSRTNPKRDWYVWRDGKGPGGKQPPNNWLSGFGGSAWEWDPKTNQFHYHRFYIQQPDLNWRNPAVEKAMFDTLRFWMDRGVSGFRLDAIPTLFEDPNLRDNKPLGGTNAYGDPKLDDAMTDNLPEVHDVLKDMRKVTNEYPGRVLIGETYLKNINELAKMYGPNQDELQLPMDMDLGITNKLDASVFRKKLNEAETQIDGNTPLFVFDNHDNPRMVARYGDGVHDDAIQRMLATLLFTTKSAAMMYYGDEIGMPTTPPTRVEDVKDPVGRTGWPKDKGRDGERTPMQWDGAKNAGFSSATKTWLPVAPDYKTVNVQAESADPNSMLNWYKKLINLRKTNEALNSGSFKMLNPNDKNVLTYLRETENGKKVVVALNFSPEPQRISLKSVGQKGRVVAASGGDIPTEINLDQVTLPSYGSIVAQVE
jgi:alpha-glucosidase